MINFENLDKERIYLGLQYGSGNFISDTIKKCTKMYAPESKEIPTHVFALVYRLGGWWIYESHHKPHSRFDVPSGVRRFRQEIWSMVEENNLQTFKAYPLDISFLWLEEYIGRPYGVGDIKELYKAWLKKSNGKQKDQKGLICSEYIAMCYKPITDFFELPAWCITPAHFQCYLDKLGIESVSE